MNKHTPGPWVSGPNARLYADPNLPECQRVVNVRLNKTTALCWDEKDARLIAAAPDLLNMLRDAENWFREYDVQNSPDSGAQLLLAEIRAAIHKATGESA